MDHNTLLVVEDDENIAPALEVLLKARGFNIYKALDAITGMQKSLGIIPDLILLDITIPGGNGLKLAEQLKQAPKTQYIPLIFLTASQESGLREQALALGASAFFEKPFDFEYLVAAIRAAIKHPNVCLSL